MDSLQFLGYFVCLFLLLFNFEGTNSKSFSLIQWCPHDESVALLQFAKSFSINPSVTGVCIDPDAYPKTKSWKEETNCCSWDGVTCDINTGHVVGLDLSCSMLQGHFHPNSSLFFLPHLQKIDLSNNDFNNSNISSNFGRFLNLTHLNLDFSNFAGRVPSEISHLSRLESLDLSQNVFLRVEKSSFDKLAQNLTNLKELNLNLVDMSLVPPSSLMNLSTSLSSLQLQFCKLKGEIQQEIFQRLSLQTLDLMGNMKLIGSFALSNVSALWYLDLALTNISISLDDDFTSHLKFLKVLNLRGCNLDLVNSNLELLGNLSHLTELDLSENHFSGHVPNSFANFISLAQLYLSSNNFSGPIPSFLGNLTQLRFSYLSENNFVGEIPVSFSNLTELFDLELSDNQLTGSLPFQLGSLTGLADLDISNNLLDGTIEHFLFGENASLYSYDSLWYINLANNKLNGPFPSSISNLMNLETLILSSNNLAGEIPSSICELKSLRILDLSNNSLGSSLPQCLGNSSNDLSVLRLNRNKFQGTIPFTFSERNVLQYMNLYGNELEGRIPPSIINCTSLEVLDLGNNNINDTFPYFLATLPQLKVLALKSNKLHGSIKIPTLTTNLSFPKLQILDVSNNSLSGNLPEEFFNNLKAMADVDQDQGHNAHDYLSTDNYPFSFFYDYSVEVTSKRLQIELANIQTLLAIIDLSSNRFTGKIPESIGKLKSLIALNFSHNYLESSIQPSLGNLANLESLDLSSNLLSGRIPQELVDLGFLQIFDVSYKTLEGPIPQGKQFNTFDSGSYVGNSGLCGFPLLKVCSSDERQPPAPSNFSETKFGFGWEVVLLGYGFGLIIGFAMERIVSRIRSR